MLFFPLLIASITLFSIAVTAVPQPAAAIAVGHLPLARLGRDTKVAGTLSNAERIVRGLPLKAPVKRFEPTRTDVLRSRQSEQPQVSAFYIRAQRSNGEVIGDLTFDAQNGVVLLPRDAPAASRVVFESPRPPAYGVTIKARNTIDGGVFPVVTRDWTRADEPMGNMGHHTVLFGYDPSTYTGDAGDPVGWYNTTRHQSSNWYIPSVPGYIDFMWYNQDGSVVYPSLWLDRTPRRVLRAAMRPEDIGLSLDYGDRVFLRTVPVGSG